ncbi:MAG: FkbM family methyltransferase [Bacteroidetes bacterium]|nr:FkbM family methyltransferase [Bacteroidota bacterium]
MNYGYPKAIGERISKHYIKKFLPANPVIIDCGSYDGGDSIEWVKAANAQMHAFEPVPRLYAQLIKNIAPYSKNIKCYTVALSNENGKAKFFVSEGKSDGSSSLLQPKEHLIDHPSVTFDESIEVDTMTLDSWAAKYNVPKVDMLWLDMQGFELHMLKASKVILDTVKVIHTEVSLKETYEGVGQYNELKDWLATKGFKVQLECIPDGYDMGNVLFVRQ